MKYLLFIALLLVTNIVTLIYLAGAPYFAPYNFRGEIEYGNIFIFLFLVSSFLGLVIALIVYLGEKFILHGWREFPAPRRSIKTGLMVFLMLIISLTLHVFGFLNFFVVAILFILVIVGIILIR